MQTEVKVQTTDLGPFKRISCYFHFRVLTINRVFQGNRSEKCALQLA